MLSNYGGHGVDIRLRDSTTNDQVFWSKRSNSWVVVADPRGQFLTQANERVDLISINGIGEIRWRGHARDIQMARQQPDKDWDCHETEAAFRHFILKERPDE